MKHTFRIMRDYTRSSDASFLIRCATVYNKMHNNPLFAQPPVKMEVLKQLIDQLEPSMSEAEHRDRLKAAQKNAIVVNLTALLDQLADYVTTVANGDEVILLSSGFAVNSNSASDSFGPVEDFTVKVGPESGQVTIGVKRKLSANNYTLYYGIDNEADMVWLHTVKGRANFIQRDLQPGKTYIFKMKIGGTNDNEAESGIITKVVA